MVLALDLLQAIAHGAQEVFVGGDHLTGQLELDHRRGAQQRLDQALVLLGGGDGGGQVVGAEREVLQFAKTVVHRLPDGAQPGLFAIAAQQAKGSAPVFRVAQGFQQRRMIGMAAERVGDQFVQRATDQRLPAVAQSLEEIVVGETNPALGVEFEHQHFAVERVLDLPGAGEFVLHLGQLLLETTVEHGPRSP